MYEEMPYLTNNHQRIPHSFSQGLPKSIKRLTAHKNNKFLNKYGSDIEEMGHVFSKNASIVSYLNVFKEYQNKHYLEVGILNHDNFYNIGRLLPIEYHKPLNLFDVGFVGLVGKTGGVDGPDLQTYTTGGGFTNRADDQLLIYRSPSTDGTIDDLYDQIAINSNNTTGNIRQGVYDDDGSDPDNLQATTGSIAMTNDFAFKSLTEFGLATVKTWLCSLKDSQSDIHTLTAAPLDQRFKTFTFGAFPDPAGTGFSTNAEGHQHKIGHS